MSNHALRVLVVDDEVELCEVACDWLMALGYSVRSVHSGAEALAALAEETFDVLFTDVIMPGGMDGLTLARVALSKQPDLRVLLASGYTRGLLEEGGGEWPMLNKPYRKLALKGAMARLAGDNAHAAP